MRMVKKLKNQKIGACSVVLAALCTTLVLGAAVAAQPAEARSVTYNLDIPSQSLNDALQALALASQHKLLYSSELVVGKNSPAIKGQFTTEQAVKALLSGTNLSYEVTSDGLVLIRAAGESASTKSTSYGPTSMSSGPVGSIHLAQDSGQPPQISSENTQNGKNQSTASLPSAEGKDHESKLEEIVVTGSRLKRVPEQEGPAPVAIFDRATIDRLGVSNVADVLNYLPQAPFSNNEAISFGGARTVQLRGLSAGSTLILINGRRTVASPADAATNIFDLNTIPLSAVERIEVLSDSASSVYGSDAVGGVVNIVLKKRIDRPSLDVYYGSAQDGAAERRASLSLGFSSERFRSSFVLDAFGRGSLEGSARDLTANEDYRRFGSSDLRTSTANPGNICSINGANLPGLAAPCAAVPFGSTGVGLSPSSFAATSGVTNKQSPTSFISLVPEAKRFSGSGAVEFDITSRAVLYAELLAASRETTTDSTPATLSNRLVPATNAYNPFGVPVRVNYLFSGIGARPDRVEDDYWRPVIGARGTVHSWDWDISTMYIRDVASDHVLNNVDSTAVNAALASATPDRALNVFQDGPGGSPSLLASLLASPVENRYTTTVWDETGFIRGSLASLPGGNVQAVFGNEFRKETLDFNALSSHVDIQASRSLWALYSEIEVPLISQDLQIPASRTLTATISARYDHYSDFGGTFNPQYGLQWSPVRGLLFRGSYGPSFRAPTLFELNEVVQTFAGLLVVDPRRHNQVIPISLLYGGNRDLKPERSKSLVIGAVITPSDVPGLKVDLSWWRIRQESRILQPLYQSIVANEQAFAGLVVRSSPSSADSAAGLPGPIASVSDTFVNSGILETSGIDLDARKSFSFEHGTLTPSLSATWVDKYRTALVPGSTITNQVGFANTNGTIPRWRGVSSVDWENSRYGISATGRYVSSYKDFNSLGLFDGITIGSQYLVDLQATAKVGKIFSGESVIFDGLVVRVGATNLLNKLPEFAAVRSLGFDPSLSDIRGRFVYAQLSKTF
jgi:iron complex outermembrane receptor protein